MAEGRNGVGRRVSVIVPVYNVEDYLRECIDSIIGQHSHDLEYEIIIVNDGSTDGSGIICDDYARDFPELVRTIHQDNAGLGGARNTGMKVAVGEYIMFVDSDDYIAPDAFSVLASALDGTEADIFIYGFSDLRGGVVSRSDMRVDLPRGGPFSLDSFPKLLGSPPSACNKLMRRSLFADNNILFPSRVWYEDLRTIPKIYLHANSVVSLENALYIYRQREGSIMNNSNTERNREIIWAMDDLVKYYKKVGAYDKYNDHLELMAISQVLIRASVRVARIDTRSIVLREIREYMLEAFPDYRLNHGIRSFPRRLKLVYLLVRAGLYGLINSLFKMRDLVR